MKAKKYLISILSALCLVTQGTYAEDKQYTKDPAALLQQMADMYSQDDKTFYAMAKDNLSDEAYEYMTADEADNISDALSGSSFVTSSSELVDILKQEMKRYNDKEGGASDDGHYYRKDFYDNDDNGKNPQAWCGVFMSYMCYKKFGLFTRATAVKGGLAKASEWASFFKGHKQYGTFHAPGTPIKAGDVVVWDHHVGMAIGGDKFISGNYSNTVKEGTISHENQKLLGTVTLNLSSAVTGVTVKGKDGGGAMKLLMSLGFSGAAAAGVVGNLVQETGGGTFTFNPKDDSHGYYGGFGMFQLDSSRKASCITFCKKNNLDPYSMDGQIKYMVKAEFDGEFATYKSRQTKYGCTQIYNSSSEYKAATDPGNAARAFAATYERCASNKDGNLPGRAKYAKVAYERWGKDK